MLQLQVWNLWGKKKAQKCERTVLPITPRTRDRVQKKKKYKKARGIRAQIALLLLDRRFNPLFLKGTIVGKSREITETLKEG